MHDLVPVPLNSLSCARTGSIRSEPAVTLRTRLQYLGRNSFTCFSHLTLKESRHEKDPAHVISFCFNTRALPGDRWFSAVYAVWPLAGAFLLRHARRLGLHQYPALPPRTSSL